MKMITQKRRVAGLRAKRVGEDWERLLEGGAWRYGAKVIRIPSGCRWITAGRAKPVKTPFDFCLIKGGKSVYLDAKTTLGAAWSYSENDPNQIHWLSQCSAGGCKAGYLISFRTLKMIVFFTVEQLSGLRPRTSLKPEDGIQLYSDGYRIDLGALFNGNKEDQTNE